MRPALPLGRPAREFQGCAQTVPVGHAARSAMHVAQVADAQRRARPVSNRNASPAAMSPSLAVAARPTQRGPAMVARSASCRRPGYPTRALLAAERGSRVAMATPVRTPRWSAGRAPSAWFRLARPAVVRTSRVARATPAAPERAGWGTARSSLLGSLSARAIEAEVALRQIIDHRLKVGEHGARADVLARGFAHDGPPVPGRAERQDLP